MSLSFTRIQNVNEPYDIFAHAQALFATLAILNLAVGEFCRDGGRGASPDATDPDSAERP